MLHDFTVSDAVPSKNNKTLSKSAEIAPSFFVNKLLDYIYPKKRKSFLDKTKRNKLGVLA